MSTHHTQNCSALWMVDFHISSGAKLFRSPNGNFSICPELSKRKTGKLSFQNSNLFICPEVSTHKAGAQDDCSTDALSWFCKFSLISGTMTMTDSLSSRSHTPAWRLTTTQSVLAQTFFLWSKMTFGAIRLELEMLGSLSNVITLW